MNKKHYIEELFDTMTQLRKLIALQAQESHEEKTATMLQFSALNFLKSQSNGTVGDLAEHIKLSKSSATQLVERLEKAGFLRRVHDKNDRRIVHLRITKQGEVKIIELKKKFMEKIGKVFSRIPERDLHELIRIHTNLIETLKKKRSN